MQLTAQGFTKDTPLQIRTDITNEALAESVGFLSFPAELRQNLVDSMVIEEVRIQDMIAALANGIGPDFANDQQYKQFGCSFGMTMKDFQYAQATIRFSGAVGTFIPRGTRVSNGTDVQLVSTVDGIIGSIGYTDILCESAQQVIIDIPANTITTLVDVIPTVAVDNPSAGTSGIPAETIAEYKAAVHGRIQSPRYGTEDRARSLLRDITGVDMRLVAFRTLDLPVTVGETTVYYRGIECVIGGGDNYEVAAALYKAYLQTKNLLSNPSGSESARTVSVDVTLYNSVAPVKFTRPKQISADLSVVVAINGQLTTNDIIEGLLKPVFEDYFDGLDVGKSVSAASMNQLIYSTLEASGIGTDKVGIITYTFDLDSVPTPMTDGYLPLEFDQYIVLSTFEAAVS